MRMAVMMPVAARFVVYVIVVFGVVRMVVAVVMVKRVTVRVAVAGFMIRVIMSVLVLVLVTMTVFVWVAMVMRMLMPMMLVEYLLGERIVFSEGLIVTMLVTTAIRARFRLERHRHLIHACTDALQHIG